MNSSQSYGHLRSSPSLVSSIFETVALHPKRIPFHFVSYQDHTQTIESPTLQTLHAQAIAFGLGLRKLGLGQGDRVILFSDQSQQDVVSLLGCLYSGTISCMIPAPIDLARQQRFISVLASSEAKAIVGNAAIQAMLAKASPELTVRTVEELLVSVEPESIRDFEPAVEEIAYLQYTSGSTNAPKGVVVSQKNVLHTVAMNDEFTVDFRFDSFVSWAPFYHNVGLMSIFTPLLTETQAIIMRPVDFMQNPLRWFQVISQFKAQATFGPNSAYNLAAKALQKSQLLGLDLSCLKTSLNGSEPLDYASLQAFTAKFSDTGFRLETFVSGYGLAESTSGITKTTRIIRPVVVDSTALAQGVMREVREGSSGAKQLIAVGGPSESYKIAIVDPENGQRLADGKIGEIWIQSRAVALGYWNNSEATQETFQAKLDGADGLWLRTGDFGTVFNTEIFITGRMKEVMIVNGHNFYPSDIIELLRTQISVLSSSPITSFSLPVDEKERIICAIEFSASDSESLAAIALEVSNIISKNYEFYPYDVFFTSEGRLPRTDNGKLQTLKIKEFYRQRKLAINYSMKQSTGEAGSKVLEQPESHLERSIFQFFAEVLDNRAFSIQDSFFMLGGDSISIARVASQIKEQLNVEIPIKFLLDNPSVKHIAKIISDFQIKGNFDGLQISGEQLKAECVLDESIVPPAYELFYQGPKKVFLTGATGFVGAYLIRDLMQMTEANIACLVRARSTEQGLKRIVENLQSYDLWDESYRERLTPVIGDLAEPGMGIAADVYEQLASDIDTIYNNGAFLNFVYPYQRLKDINVSGTAECLRLACLKRAKYFHHVSTFSVYDNPSHFDRHVAEDDPLVDPTGYFLGYTESKWVAEKLVQIAASRGLKTAVYRPGEISGASDTGIWKMSDAVIRSMIASIQVKAMPDVSMRFHLTPVDYVSKALVTLSLQAESIGHAFNLINKNVKAHPELCVLMNELGWNVELVSFEEWRRRVFDAEDDNALKPLETLLLEKRQGAEAMEQRYGMHEAEFSVDSTLKGLEGTGVSCAPVDQKLLATYFAYFRAQGYVASHSS